MTKHDDFLEKSNKKKHCNFCGRGEKEVDFLVQGLNNTFICNNCIEEINFVIDHKSDSENEKKQLSSSLEKKDKNSFNLTAENLPKPIEIKNFLDQYVIGQTEAKKHLSVAVYNHYKRILYKNGYFSEENSVANDVEIEKSNVLMVGPTGTGKTLLAQTIARKLNVPFAIVDATVLTEAGYVGEDIESILSRLVQAANGDVKKAEYGIVFIDEIDKIARKGDNPSITRDVSGEGVQQGLLKLLEGADINVPPEGGRKHPEQKFLKVNTRHILFICAGAFVGLERHISNRLNTRYIGFTSNDLDNSNTLGDSQKWNRQSIRENLMQYVTHKDLQSFGLIPEILGRLPILTYINPLDREMLKKILIEPKNSILKQYIELFKMDGITLSFDQEALDFIVDIALKEKLGARGLRSITEAVMMDAMFTTPSEKTKELHITKEYVKEHCRSIPTMRS